jgi:hypothetical protein
MYMVICMTKLYTLSALYNNISKSYLYESSFKTSIDLAHGVIPNNG